jgi:hypothetical protein
MRRDETSTLASVITGLIALFLMLLHFAFWGGILWVAYHFISKWW